MAGLCLISGMAAGAGPRILAVTTVLTGAVLVGVASIGAAALGHKAIEKTEISCRWIKRINDCRVKQRAERVDRTVESARASP